MNEDDLALRNLTYARFVELGREPLRIAVRDRRPDDTSLLFHCLVPAARWWDDIVFT
jgi:hypothetical protein